MNLETELFRTRGRAAKPVEASIVRELDAADLVLLSEEKGSTPPPLKRLSERHHALARTLASGVSSGEAAIMCGYNPSRVSILLDDPAFQDLLAFYRADVQEQYRGLHEELAGLSIDAARELSARLEAEMQAEDKTLSVGQLIEITKLGADRTGHGPSSSTTNLNVNVDMAGRLEAARRRVQERTNGQEPRTITDARTGSDSDARNTDPDSPGAD